MTTVNTLPNPQCGHQFCAPFHCRFNPAPVEYDYDYSDSTTQIFGPIRTQLTDALSRGQWGKSRLLAAKMINESLKIATFCDSKLNQQPTAAEAATEIGHHD